MSYAYYRWFPGDYMRDTQHLGWLEDCAYRRLIDLYCLHGKPIRNDLAYIRRACRATEPEQQAAVDNVLSEFFELKPDGWHQKRCDAEIKYRRSISEQAKRAVQARENKKLQSDDERSIIGRSSNQNQNHITTKPARTYAREPKIPWWSTSAGIEAKGLELGMRPRPGEDWNQFKGRINSKLNETLDTP